MTDHDRKIVIRTLIEERLKDILRCAKKRQTYNVNDYASQLFGMLEYACIAGDITKETDARINNLVWIIKKKYYI